MAPSPYLSIMNDLKALTEAVIAFRDARDWEQYHNPKDLAISLAKEANEVLEEYLWKAPGEADLAAVKDELGDVFYNLLLLCHTLNVDPAKALKDKIEKINQKYPVAKAKGRRDKYNKL